MAEPTVLTKDGVGKCVENFYRGAAIGPAMALAAFRTIEALAADLRKILEATCADTGPEVKALHEIYEAWRGTGWLEDR
jgi:hypothetical protein